MEFTIYEEFPLELEEEWNTLLEQSTSHVPFLRFEYLQTWWNTRGGGEWQQESGLAIIVAREGRKLAGIAPLFKVEAEGKTRLLLLGSIEISDYLDLICRQEDLEDFSAGLLSFIKSRFVTAGNACQLDLYNILEDSATLPVLTQASREQNFLVTEEKLQHCPYIPLPGDWEKYLEGIDKKQRHEIRRKMRRAAEAEVPASFYITSDPDKLEEDGDDFLVLMAQDEDKAKFLTPLMRENMKELIRCSFDKGCLQLAFLTIGEKKAAAYLSFDYLNRIWVYNSGLDRAFMSYSPGWVLLGFLLQWANENGREEFDFMRGDEDYKYKFGAVDRFVVRLTIQF